MLIEFRVSNFRSLRDEQVLSMVASNDKSLQDNTITTVHHAVSRLLKTAVVYGANASGKSNLIKALQFMRGVVLESASLVQPGQSYNLQAFRLDDAFAGQATQFELTFMLDNVRYQYGFAMTSERILAEHLLVYKTAKPQRWFERCRDEATGKDVYEYSTSLKGPKNLWEGATRPNALFLSMAAQLNSEALQPLFNWFANGLEIFNEQSQLNLLTSIEMLQQSEGKKAINRFLETADISIADIAVTTRKVPRQSLHVDLQAGKTDIRQEEVDEHQLQFFHVTDKGQAVFDLMDESAGTRNLIFLSGPILDVLKRGATLVIDELDTSLHPLLVRALVRLFHQSRTPEASAQLIFTTHDTSLLDAPDLLRRDQIWLMEKDNAQASSLVALAEFSPRIKEALGRGYLTGRYGAIPLLEQTAVMVD